nr:site-specific integrase [Terrabacter sp. MAHUQ-38]
MTRHSHPWPSTDGNPGRRRASGVPGRADGGTPVKGPRVERQEVVPWIPDEAGQFLESLAGHRLHALFAVGVALGLPEGELLALRWDDVDLKAGILRVRATVQRLGKGVGLVTGSPKTTRSRRTLPRPRVLVDTLAAHRAAQSREREAAGPRWQDAGLVFATSRGTTIEPRNLNRFLDEAIARAGLRRIRFHDLRHTCASLLLAQGVSARVVMEVLRHTQLSMTTDLYGHVMPSSLRSAADALDGVFGK